MCPDEVRDSSASSDNEIISKTGKTIYQIDSWPRFVIWPGQKRSCDIPFYHRQVLCAVSNVRKLDMAPEIVGVGMSVKQMWL